MAFSNGQLVGASDLNNLNITTLTTTGAVSVGGALSVTGAATTSTINGQTISSSASLTGTLAVAGALSPAALVDISGASAGQVKFPASQNASTNANTLDDYEEGLSANSWVPVIGGSGGTSGQAYSSQIGEYIKISRLVIAWFDVTLSTLGTITGSAQIQGLPFTVANVGSVFGGHISFWGTTTSNFVFLGLTGQVNTTTASIVGATAAGTALANTAQADFANTTRLIGVIVYPATG